MVNGTWVGDLWPPGLSCCLWPGPWREWGDNAPSAPAGSSSCPSAAHQAEEWRHLPRSASALSYKGIWALSRDPDSSLFIPSCYAAGWLLGPTQHVGAQGADQVHLLLAVMSVHHLTVMQENEGLQHAIFPHLPQQVNIHHPFKHGLHDEVLLPYSRPRLCCLWCWGGTCCQRTCSATAWATTQGKLDPWFLHGFLCCIKHSFVTVTDTAWLIELGTIWPATASMAMPGHTRCDLTEVFKQVGQWDGICIP